MNRIVFHDGVEIDNDPQRLDVSFIHDFLSNRSYWAPGRSMEKVKRSIQHSLCFGVYAKDGRQVGFARVITDKTTFAWLCDLFIHSKIDLREESQGKGLAKRLVETIVNHPDINALRRFMLVTNDAHELYRKYGGFKELHSTEECMELFKTEL